MPGVPAQRQMRSQDHPPHDLAMPDSLLDLYGTLIDNSPVAMVLYDRDMRIVHLNDEFARLSRLDARQARGKVLYDLAPATRARRHIHDTVLSGESIDQANVPYKFPERASPYLERHPLQARAGS